MAEVASTFVCDASELAASYGSMRFLDGSLAPRTSRIGWLFTAAFTGLFACTTSDVAPLNASTSSAPSEPEPVVDAPEPAAPGVREARLAVGISITDVAIFQAVKATVVANGALVAPADRNAPVVANRPGMARVYVKPNTGWKAQSVTAELRLAGAEGEPTVVRESKRIARASRDDDPESTIDLELPSAALTPKVKFQVSLTSDDDELVADGAESGARFPRDGTLAGLGVFRSGTLRVVVVPVRYDADGSGRTPDVGAARLARYEKTLMKLYPASGVEVTAHAPYPWNETISPDGGGISDVLRAIMDLRESDGVDDDVYYYGLVMPAPTLTSYCKNGCVSGLSVFNEDDVPALRASVGIGYVGADSESTMAHELGHAHGRAHAPCGDADGIDPDYPYPQGEIGVWGYDIVEKRTIPPTSGRDIMGYCPNEWVSDYTYRALFERISMVSNTGAAKLSARRATDPAPRMRVVARSEERSAMSTPGARFVPFDHLPGGVVLVRGAGGRARPPM